MNIFVDDFTQEGSDALVGQGADSDEHAGTDAAGRALPVPVYFKIPKGESYLEVSWSFSQAQVCWLLALLAAAVAVD